MAGRDEMKLKAALQRIQILVPEAELETEVFDLADQTSIKDWAKGALDDGRPINLLLNNAGVMATPELRTADGFEYQLGVNHLGHYTLTNLLLPLIKGGGDGAVSESRIVNVSSAAHYFGQIHFDDPFLRSPGAYNEWKSYGQSKLANVMFTYELAQRLGPASGISTNTLHPGMVNTELARYLLPAAGQETPFWQKPLLNFTKMFTLTPEQGAKTSVYLSQSSEVEGVTAKYFDKCKPTMSSPASYDRDAQKKLWELSAELTGVSEL